MPKPHARCRPSRRHKPHPADYAALLSRLTTLEAALIKQSGPRGLAEASPSLVRLTAGLLDETRAHLPGAVRKRNLPRIAAKDPVSHAELCVIAGQARAALAAFVAARGLDKPPAAPDPRIDALRAKLVARIAQLVDEREAARAAEEAAAETASP